MLRFGNTYFEGLRGVGKLRIFTGGQVQTKETRARGFAVVSTLLIAPE
jgi:hypothetical protein